MKLLLRLIFVVLFARYLWDVVKTILGIKFCDIPYVASSGRACRQVVNRIKMKPGEKLMELGSGEGVVTLAFAKKYSGIEAVGVEKAWWLVVAARIRSFLTPFKRGKVSFVRGDFFKIDLRQADVVYLYLCTETNERLRPKLERELRRGARVVSLDYPLKSNKFKLVDDFKDRAEWVMVYRRK